MIFGGCSKGNKEKALEYYKKGRQLYASQNLKQAAYHFKEAASLDHHLKQSYLMEAKCYFYLQSSIQALEVLNQVLRQHPGYVEARFWAGKLYYFGNDYSTAEMHLLQVVQDNSSHLQARYLLGDLYLQQNMYDKALLNYQMVEKNLDMVGMAKVNIARIYTEYGLYRRALEHIAFIEKNKEFLEEKVLDQAYEVLAGMGEK